MKPFLLRIKMEKYIVTKDFLHECFDYVEGDLYWKERPLSHFMSEKGRRGFNFTFAGKKAGAKCKTGYTEVHFKLPDGTSRTIGAHRIVFVMHHGYFPTETDHKDGNRSNNKIENLREATRSENTRNVCVKKTNSSGIKGVSWHKDMKKWTAHIRKDGKWKQLGCFDSKEEAAKVRMNAEVEHYKDFRRVI